MACSLVGQYPLCHIKSALLTEFHRTFPLPSGLNLHFIVCSVMFPFTVNVFWHPLSANLHFILSFSPECFNLRWAFNPNFVVKVVVQVLSVHFILFAELWPCMCFRCPSALMNVFAHSLHVKSYLFS